jgi:hypothetical protein
MIQAHLASKKGYGVILKYQHNCKEMLFNSLSSFYRSLVNLDGYTGVEDVYFANLDTKQATKEFILSRICNAVSTPIIVENLNIHPNHTPPPKTLFKYFGDTRRVRECVNAGATIRLIAQEKIGNTIEKLFLDAERYDLEYLINSTLVFIEGIRILKKLHDSGIILGDIHLKNIAFSRVGIDYKDLHLHLETNFSAIMFIDLGFSQFYLLLLLLLYALSMKELDYISIHFTNMTLQPRNLRERRYSVTAFILTLPIQ